MNTRRRFLGLSAAAIASSLAVTVAPGLLGAQDAPPVPPPGGSRKKGLGRGVRNAGWAKNLADLRCKWFYSWNSSIPEGIPAGVEFIPMIYRYRGDAAAVASAAAAAKAAGITELMGFNEPDAAKQGNMTVEEALDAWPVLMETGMRLGSPGCVHPDKDWMNAFMAGVKERGLRVDYVCVHSYGGPNADALVARLERVHAAFGLPIWITEFGVGDWAAKTAAENRHKPETVLRFMEQVLPKLDALDFVERYAWFPSRLESPPLGSSALFDDTGVLTPLGELYRDA